MQPPPRSLLGLCGSLAAQSVNRSLLLWIGQQLAPCSDLRVWDGWDAVPHFNPDLLGDSSSPAVVLFKEALRGAAGVVICTPEYAMGPPGALKNLLDWTVATADFSGKPVLLVTAASVGEKAHVSLLGTLRVIEAVVDDACAVHIPFAKARVGAGGGVADPATEAWLLEALAHFKTQCGGQ